MIKILVKLLLMVTLCFLYKGSHGNLQTVGLQKPAEPTKSEDDQPAGDGIPQFSGSSLTIMFQMASPQDYVSDARRRRRPINKHTL